MSPNSNGQVWFTNASLKKGYAVRDQEWHQYADLTQVLCECPVSQAPKILGAWSPRRKQGFSIHIFTMLYTTYPLGPLGMFTFWTGVSDWFWDQVLVTTVGEPPWAWHDAGSEGIQSSPRFLTCGQLFRPTRPGWEDGSHGFPWGGILTCEVSKLLDRHGKYKYDDAAPDEDEPRHLDLSEKKGGKTIWSKFEPVRICNRCNLLRIRRCLHCLEPCLQEVFGGVGTKRNLSGFSYEATRNMATFIPCAYPLHWMLMLNTDNGCICILGAYNAVSYHSYHASDW